MDISSMREFLVLADCLNFSKAAQRLFITQPMLSRHIYKIEEELNTQLFFRDTHSVSLTPAGEAAVSEFKAVTERYDAAAQTIANVTNAKMRLLSIGALGYAVNTFFLDLVLDFEKNNPSVSLRFISDSHDRLCDMVIKGTIDAAFITHMGSLSAPDIEELPLLKDSMCALLPKDSPLREKKSIRIEDLAEQPMIHFDESLAQSEFNQELFKKHGTPYNIVRQVPNVDTAMYYVDLGIGSLILPRHLIKRFPDRLYIPISDDDCFININLIWSSANKNPILADFVTAVRKLFKID